MREKSWKGKPTNPANEARAKQESCFWEMFIPAALAYLTFNLNMMKGLANGVPVKYHSISFNNEDEQRIFEELLECSAPGEVITLTQPPDIINVEMFPDFPGEDNKTRSKDEEMRRAWKHGSITDDGKVVIPIAAKHVKWKETEIRGGGGGGGGSRFRPSKVELADYFPIEPGFSVTIHKAQVRPSCCRYMTLMCNRVRCLPDTSCLTLDNKTGPNNKKNHPLYIGTPK